MCRRKESEGASLDDKEFEGVSLDDLNRSWIASLRWGWYAKVRHSVIWKSPQGLFKLNFDGSYLRSICRGCIGGAIRDWNGNVVKSFFEPFDAKDANEAEVFALLIGCRELSRLDGYKAIIEGDSVSVIQWGLGKSSHRWRIANWVEEVHDISQKLDVQFRHIQRKANVMADCLPGEGVFRTSLSFDV